MCFRHDRWILVVAVPFERWSRTLIDGADDLAQTIAVAFERGIPRGRRRAVVFPESIHPSLRRADPVFDEPMGTVHQAAGQVFFRPFERGRLRQPLCSGGLTRVRPDLPFERLGHSQNDERDSREEGSQRGAMHRRSSPQRPGASEMWTTAIPVRLPCPESTTF
jgi:hypothetical protein